MSSSIVGFEAMSLDLVHKIWTLIPLSFCKILQNRIENLLRSPPFTMLLNRWHIFKGVGKTLYKSEMISPWKKKRVAPSITCNATDLYEWLTNVAECSITLHILGIIWTFTEILQVGKQGTKMIVLVSNHVVYPPCDMINSYVLLFSAKNAWKWFCSILKVCYPMMGSLSCDGLQERECSDRLWSFCKSHIHQACN